MDNEIITNSDLPKASDVIVYGGLAIGVLDGLAACASNWLAGGTAKGVWIYVSSALIGYETAKLYDWKAALLGLLMHFGIAFSVATVYYLVSRNIPFLTRNALISGPLFGILVHLAMTFLIVPLTRVPPIPFSASGFVKQLLIHIFFVGLPPALIAQWSAQKNLS